MSLKMRNVRIGQIDYQAGSKKYLSNGLPKDHPYFGLSLRLSGRVTATGGTTSGTPWAEAPMTLIERVRVFGTKKGSGAVEIVNLPAATLYELARYFARTAPEIVAVANGDAGDHDFACEIPVPLHIPNMGGDTQALSLLPSHLFDDLQLEITWRDGTSTTNGGLISAGDRAITVTAYGSAAGVPSVEVVAYQVTNAGKQQAAILSRLYAKTLVTESVEAARKEQVNIGAFYRGLLIKPWIDTTTRALSNSLITNVKLLVSGNAQEEWPFAQLRAHNKRLYSLESVQTGYALIDFAPNKQPNTLLDTRRFGTKGTSLEVELAISGAANNRVDLVVLEAVPAGRW